MEQKMHYIVTINRQFGSLGRPIARKLSEKLGIRYCDRDIVDQTAQKLNMPVSKISDLEESAQGNFFSMKYPLGMGTTDVQDQIFEEQRLLISKIATKESCVIVGRCADAILREFPNVIRVYIFAPNDERIKVCIDDFHMQKDEARRMMLEVDKTRERYHKQYAGYLPSDSDHVNITIDSSILGVDGTVDVLTMFVNKFLDKQKEV